MSDWYENAPTRLSSAPLNPSIPRSRHSREGGNPGEAYGWQMTRTQLLQSAPRFSYLGVPAPAGMSDWYENAPTRLSSAPLNPSIPRSRHSREGGNPGEAYGWQMTRTQLLQSAPRFSYLGVPAPAGMDDWYENEWFPPPNSSSRRKPESRGDCNAGACPQPGSHGHPAGESRHPLHHPRPHFVMPTPAGIHAKHRRRQ